MSSSKPQRSMSEIEDIILKKIFLVTLTDSMTNDSRIIYLEMTSAEILSEGHELKLNIDLMERVLVDRLSFNSSSNNSLIEPPFEYLVNVYRRAYDEGKKIANMKDKTVKARMELVVNQAKKLAVSYVRIHLGNPDMFSDDTRTKSNVSPLLGLIFNEVSSSIDAFGNGTVSGASAPPGFLDELFRDTDYDSMEVILKQLYEDLRGIVLKCSALGNFQQPLRALMYLISFPVGAKGLVNHQWWIPKGAYLNGRVIEMTSILGPFFHVSALPDQSIFKGQPDVGQQCFSESATRRPADLVSAFTTIKTVMNNLYDGLAEVLRLLLKNTSTRENVLQYIAEVINKNASRAHIQLGDMESWEIVHIPDKAPFPIHQQPTVSVYAAVIDPKHAHTLVRKLNEILPLESLRHAKRVRKQHLDGGSTQLSVILCIAGEDDSQLHTIPQEIVELIDSYQLETFITKVCRYAPISKDEWKEQSKIWPTSFHQPIYNISGITGFSEEESRSICTFMKLALDLAKSDTQMVNAAVVVDPSNNEVIARACDQVHSCSCSISHEVTNSSSLEYSIQSHDNVLLNSSASEPKLLFPGVSCLNPWGWSNRNSCGRACSWHPLRHAAIVAIEHSAARDRRLFPGSGHVFAETDHVQPDLSCPSSKKQKTKSIQVKVNAELNSDSNGSLSDVARPYLCTGYDIYLIWEPCAMCAMALVHQRIKRIFYAFPNPTTGALGSVHRLQGEKSLNHHYAVFKVSLSQESLDREGISLISKGNVSEKTENPSTVPQAMVL